VILSSVCLLGRHALAEEFEVFPLSGGIDNGVTVTIDVTGFVFPTQVEFLKPSREVAFRVHLDGSTVTRSSDLGGDDKITLNYGAWPGLSATVSAKFEFTKRSETWAVAIDGKRFPWFDFPHQHTKDELLTHVRVYSGMTDAEVTLERKPCSVACHPDECSCSSSNATDGECVSVTKSGCGRSDETTPDEEEHCCDGLENSLPIEEDMVGKFVVIQDDPDHVDKVCKAFSASCTAAKDKQFSSKPVKIISVDKEKATVNVFVPFAQDSRLQASDNYALPDSVKFDFPVFALKKKAKVEYKLVQFGAGGDGDSPFIGNPARCSADAHNAVVVSSEETKVPKGWYINLVRLRVNIGGTPTYRWVLFNRFARGQLSGGIQADVAMQLTDADVPVMGGCRDSASSWRDVMGRDCKNYTEGEWCNRHGESTDQGKAVFGSDTGTPPTGDNLPKGEDPNYITAAYECCECGGGRHDKPAGASPGPTLLNDNLFE